MQKKEKDKIETEQKEYKPFNYPEIEDSGKEYGELIRENSLATDSDEIDMGQQKEEEEQKEILDLREVIKNAARDNAVELTETIQKMLSTAKDVMEKNNQALTDKSIDGLKELMLKGFEDIGTPINQVNDFIINEEKQKEMEELREQMVENIAKIDMVLKDQRERVDTLEDKTKGLIKNIVEKIIGIEISEQSEKIIMTNIALLFGEYRDAQEVKIFLNKRDFQVIKERVQVYLDLKEMVITNLIFQQDENIKAGSFLIITDKGNFDNNIEDRMNLIINSIL